MSENLTVRRLARRFALRIVRPDALTIQRRRQGAGFSYRHADGTRISDPQTLARLRSLAIPPAYVNVRLAPDPNAHLQAVGEDAAGRLQYRYHPDWTRVREAVKARRLAGLAEALPLLSRALRRTLRSPETDRTFALAAAAWLVARTSIRAGSERYAAEHGTRGATTLLKSHVRIEGDEVTLRFTGKGGKPIARQVRDAALAEALVRLMALPGRRLFKYRGRDGKLHPLRAADVNAFLRETGRCPISLKDFRTLTASLGVLDQLSRLTPERSERGRRRQIRGAVSPLADELANTLTVCRTSYVHDAVIEAFESGRLGKAAGAARSTTARASLLAALLRDGRCRPLTPVRPRRAAVSPAQKVPACLERIDAKPVHP